MFKHVRLWFLAVFALLSIFSLFSHCAAAQALDTDGDGLTDADEAIWGTNPSNPDTDADGLKDGEEVYTYLTLPTDSDTDKDGLSDGMEVITYGTDPLKQSTDGDMYSDRQELYGTDLSGKSMPGYVLPPGDNVFVAAYPVISIDILKDVMITEIAEIYTEFREINMSEVSYAVSNTNGVSMAAGTTAGHKKSEWIDVGNEQEDAKQQSAYHEDIRSTEEKSWKGYSFGAKVEAEVGEEKWLKAGAEVGAIGPVPNAKISAEAGDRTYASVKGTVETGSTGDDYVGESNIKKVTGETVQSRILKTYEKKGSGQESSFSTTVTRTSYHETSVTNTNSIATGEEWATATTVDPSRAAKLRFTFYLKNVGTDIAKEVEDLRFNIFIGDSVIPITYPALDGDGISLSNLKPGERIQFSGEVTITLDELMSIDMGQPIRIMMAYYSYGDDELFYESAWGEDVLVEIDDDPLGIRKTTKNFMTYTKYDENYVDVLVRLNRTVRIRSQGARVEVPLKLLNGTVASISGLPVTEWSSWTAYLQEPTDVTKFSDEASDGKTRLLLVYNNDSDHDHYSDRIETSLGTGINDASSHPSPFLGAGYYKETDGSNVTVWLKFTNYGNFDAYGIEARMYSPDGTTAVLDGFVGGGGRIEAGRIFTVYNETLVYTNLTQNFASPVIIVYYNDPQGYHSFIVDEELPDLGNETVPSYHGDMIKEPRLTVQSNPEYSYSRRNFFIVNYENPAGAISNATIFVAFQSLSGEVAYYENRSVDLETGNNSFVFWWNPSDSLPEEVLGEEYKAVVALTDYRSILLYDDVQRFRIVNWRVHPEFIDTFDDGSAEKFLVFDEPGTQTIWVKIPRRAIVEKASAGIEGLEHGGSYPLNPGLSVGESGEDLDWKIYGQLKGAKGVQDAFSDSSQSKILAFEPDGPMSHEYSLIIPKNAEIDGVKFSVGSFAPSLVLENDEEGCIYGSKTYQWVILKDNSVLPICGYNGTLGTGELNLTAHEVIIDETSKIEGTGRGWRGGLKNSDGNGPGGAMVGYGGGSGGGYGGNGGDGMNSAGKYGAAYGNESDFSAFMGSGGSGGYSVGGSGGSGGASMIIKALEISIKGRISADGGDGNRPAIQNGDDGPSGGGGSGGTIMILGGILNLSGAQISSYGGSGGYISGGGGAGGRIKIFYGSLLDSANSYISAEGAGKQNAAQPGENGTVFVEGRDLDVNQDFLPTDGNETGEFTVFPNLSVDFLGDGHNEVDHLIIGSDIGLNVAGDCMAAVENGCQLQSGGNEACDVSIDFSSETMGVMNVSLELAYTLQYPDVAEKVQESLSECNNTEGSYCIIPVSITSDSLGIVDLSGVRIFYDTDNIKGDVGGDCHVSIADLSAVGQAYGSVSGDKNWNPDADFNSDGRISIVDLATVGKHYGEEC